MEAKYLGHLLCWHCVDLVDMNVVAVVAKGELVERAHCFIFAIGVVWLDHLLGQEVLQQGHQYALVCTFTDSTSVVALSEYILKRVKGHAGILVDEVVQLPHRDL
jgi:hypothetical protein